MSKRDQQDLFKIYTGQIIRLIPNDSVDVYINKDDISHISYECDGDFFAVAYTKAGYSFYLKKVESKEEFEVFIRNYFLVG